jgi:hypothetical protein
MQNSKLLPLSIITNIKKFVDAKRKINENFDVYKLTHEIHYNKSRQLIKDKCTQVYNEIENHYYNHRDFALFVCCEYLYNNSFSWKNIDFKNINIVKDLFSESRFLLDQQMIIDMNEQTKFERLSQYFKLNNNGISIIYNLIIHEKKFISPLFFIKYEKLIKNESDVDSIPSEDYIYFIKLTKLLKLIITNKTTIN